MLHSIYALANPGTDEIFYIGCTTDLKARMNGHTYGNIKSKTNRGVKATNKDLYILQLMKTPVCYLIEEVEGSDAYALQRENFWIVFMTEFGFPLVNMVSKDLLKEPATVGDIMSALKTLNVMLPQLIAA